MKNEEQEKRIADFCVECLKDCEKNNKINGVCPDCAKKLFRK
jgi:hypothetical protein